MDFCVNYLYKMPSRYLADKTWGYVWHIHVILISLFFLSKSMTWISRMEIEQPTNSSEESPSWASNNQLISVRGVLQQLTIAQEGDVFSAFHGILGFTTVFMRAQNEYSPHPDLSSLRLILNITLPSTLKLPKCLSLISHLFHACYMLHPMFRPRFGISSYKLRKATTN
jgi:hypothetical protein